MDISIQAYKIYEKSGDTIPLTYGIHFDKELLSILDESSPKKHHYSDDMRLVYRGYPRVYTDLLESGMMVKSGVRGNKHVHLR